MWFRGSPYPVYPLLFVPNLLVQQFRNFTVSPRWAQDFPKRLLQCCPVAVAMFCCGKSSVAEPVVYRRDVPIRGAPPNSDHSVPFRVADVWRVMFRWVFLLGNQKERRQNTKKFLQFETSALSASISLQVIKKKTGHENPSQNPRPLCFLRSLVGASPKRLGHWFYRSASGRRCFQPNFRSRRLRGWEASSGVGSGATTAGAAVEICRVSGGGKQVVEVWGSSRNRETKVVIVGRKLVWIFFVFFFGGHGWVLVDEICFLPMKSLYFSNWVVANDSVLIELQIRGSSHGVVSWFPAAGKSPEAGEQIWNNKQWPSGPPDVDWVLP